MSLISNAMCDINLHYESEKSLLPQPQPFSPPDLNAAMVESSLHVASVPHQAIVSQVLSALLPGDVHQGTEGCSAVSMGAGKGLP